jgi:competence protein ComEC
VRDTWANLVVDSEQLQKDAQTLPVEGAVLVRAPRFPEYQYGDRLRVSGLLQTPPELEGFSYREYLAHKEIYSLIDHPHIEKLGSGQGSPFWTALYTVKNYARDTFARLIPEPEAALLQGILLGIRTGIPPDLYDDYNSTGTSHIIVISGSNITLVAGLFALTFGRLLGKRRAYWLTLAGITLYILLVGADPVVVRAGIMGGLFVTALYLGRRATAYVSLFASALVLTLINPFSLWDVGFQLSFAATLGMIVFSPAIERLFERGLTPFLSQDRTHQALRLLRDALFLTLAAQVLVLPLVIYHFGRVSLVSPLANLLILPVQPPVMTFGAAAGLTGLVPLLEPLAQVLAWIPWLCLAYTNAVVRWMAAWPFAAAEIDRINASWIIATYLILISVLWIWGQRRQSARRAWSALISRPSIPLLLGGPLVIALLSWLAVLQLPDGRLHVAFLDVGQGDAILITSPDGRQILVDGGPSPSALTSALGHEMPFWDRSLDLVVMTHPDADHITGLVEVLDRYRVEAWLDSGQPSIDALYTECIARLEENAVAHHQVRTGDRLELGPGIVLEVVHPPSESLPSTAASDNNGSLVLRLVWEDAEFLLTGDIEMEVERLLLGSGQPIRADVLKVAHHGSGGSTTADFLSAVDPRYAILSVGSDNRFGHPHPAVLDRLDAYQNLSVLRTDELGTVEFVTDGHRLWVTTDR